jgi:pSer/pThr/pTyr-binding forkhead associated (FHA) protein/tetratricopeptide (TPR) repeat protein
VKLIVLKNNVPLREVSVDTTDPHESYEIYVGRSEDCHVQVDDPLISRHHLVLRNRESSWFCEKLTQLGSVILNGALVDKTAIRAGDEIKCGAYSILVSELSDLEAPTPMPPLEELSQTVVMSTPSAPEPVQATEELTPSFTASEELSETAPEATPSEEPFPMEDPSETSSEASENMGFSLEEDAGSVSGEDSNFNLDSPSESFDMIPSEEEENTRFFKAFVNYQLVLFGEHAPYDRYQIDQDEIYIGRDSKKCQIVLNDPEVSSVHAVLRKNNNDITLEDLNSSNGTILNAERINKAQLMTGDEFVIGSTSFTLEVKSDLLESESDRLMPVESGQIIEREEIEEELVTGEEGAEITFDSEAPVEKSIIKRIWKNPQQRKKAIYVVAALVFAYVLLDEDEPKEETKAPVTKAQPAAKDAKPKLVLSKELEERRNVAYELGVDFFEQNKYFEALKEFQTVAEIDPNYKKIQTYLEQTKVGLKRLEELEAQRRAEEDRIKLKKVVDELLVKAREAVKERQVVVAENFFTQITDKDPENIEVQQLKLELEAWQKEEERKALEKAAKEAARKRMVDALSPGKTYYLKKEWYRAILKLEEFLRMKAMDEDLIKEASDMLSDAKTQLANDLGPLLGKARSLKEGQDLKSAYEAFLDILKIEPTNSEALNEVDDIKTQLDSRSKKIYREAIIAESLSLFSDAKEKFQEVQQISPTDSDYYKKATEKLKNYLE